MKSLEQQSFIVLSIHEIHAERIFSGQKIYELRKVLPKTNFSKVFLYQTGGKGLVGAFDVKSITQEKPDKLWKKVKELATSKDRFFAYFEGRELGCAIEISNPIRFNTSLSKSILEKKVDTFTAPQSYLKVEPDTLMHKQLLSIYKTESKKKSLSRRSSSIQRPVFLEL